MIEKYKHKGMGIFGMITLILIVLKVFGVVDLEWLVVLSPIFISFAFNLASLLLTLLVILYRRIRK